MIKYCEGFWGYKDKKDQVLVFKVILYKIGKVFIKLQELLLGNIRRLYRRYFQFREIVLEKYQRNMIFVVNSILYYIYIYICIIFYIYGNGIYMMKYMCVLICYIMLYMCINI